MTDEHERVRHAIHGAIEFLDDLEASGVVDEWLGGEYEPRVSDFYMTLGDLREALRQSRKALR